MELKDERRQSGEGERITPRIHSMELKGLASAA